MSRLSQKLNGLKVRGPFTETMPQNRSKKQKRILGVEWSEWSKYVYVSQGLELREYYAAACGHCQAAGPFASSCCCELFSKLFKGVPQCEGAAVGRGPSICEALAPAWKAAQSAYSGPVTFRPLN